MATFKVGQRVRIVRCNAWPILNGREGTVLGPSTLVQRKFSPSSSGVWEWIGYPVRPDGYDPTSGLFFPHADQLEPVQPEGNQVVAWSDCAWTPEHMREVA